MAKSQKAEGMDVSALFGVLRRGALIIVGVAAIAALAAYLISKGQETKYSASTALLLQGAAPGDPNSQFAAPSPTDPSDREALVLSGDVLARAQRSLAGRLKNRTAAKRLLNDVSASSLPDSSIVDVSVTAPDAARTALAANTIAQANIDSRRTTSLRKIDKARRADERQLANLGRPTPDNAAATSALTQELVNLRRQAETSDGDARVVKAAAAPSSPSSPKPKQTAVIAGFGGLLLGLALALVREQMDRRVRDPKQLEETFGLPVLASVPRSRALAETNGQALAPLPGLEAEAFQILRANLRYLNTERELRSVVVTSASVGDGKSTVSLNLAKAEATVGKKVLLIEADLRRPRLANVLGIGATDGLATFLGNRSKELAEVTNRVPVVHRKNGSRGGPLTMDVVVAGPVPENPSELIDSERMRELITAAERDYDLVVIDTAPASMVADAIPLMTEATAVVIVSRVGKIKSDEASSLREQLERIDAPSFGLVANFSPGQGKYSYGYY
jgi:succinoglycan biosynthesis transport protein ExoP